MNKQLYIYDCLNGKLRASDSNFMTLGSGERCSFRVVTKETNAGSFAQRDGTCRFFPHSKVTQFSLNGVKMGADALIQPNAQYLLIIAGACLICWFGDPADRPDFSQLNPKVWYIHDAERDEWRGPFKLKDVPVESQGLDEHTYVTFHGLNNAAFYLCDIVDVAHFHMTQLSSNAPNQDLATKKRLFVCPSCWKKLGKKEALAISSHPELYGDELLGEDAPQRFTPGITNEQGLPIDSMGSPCTEFACPHCHHKLPPFFDLSKQHIFSLVGIPAAGKTYYLASLVHQLSRDLPREFNVPFRDADPISNTMLNDMSMKLFTGRSPLEAYLGKTRLEGSLYQKVWRHQHFSDMPRPFIYNINKSDEAYSVVLYDNAGEHYEPGRGGEESPGAEHLAIASSILYLFDPTTNLGFRNLLRDNKDPQLQRDAGAVGKQGLLLAETEMRLRTRLNVPPGRKVNVPIAVMIGKCDIWQHLLGPEPLLPIVRHGVYLPDHVNANSARLRRFLFNISPNICSNAEAISDNVRYFAVSALGKSPIECMDDLTGRVVIAPDTSGIDPIRVTDPFIWALSCCENNIFPSPTK